MEIQWKNSRDIGILRKAITLGNIYYIHDEMSVRRLWSVGNFNNRLRDKGAAGRIELMESDLETDNSFNLFTNGKYADALAVLKINSILYISQYDMKYARNKAKELSYPSCLNNLIFKKKLKLYFLIKHPKLLVAMHKFKRKHINGNK